MTCPSCGAAVRTDASWCGQCHAPLASAAQPVAERVAALPVQQLPPPPPEFSRWRGGDLSMGPVGRVLWTIVMVVIGALCLFSQNPFAIGPWWLIAMPLVLRSVWAKKRIT